MNTKIFPAAHIWLVILLAGAWNIPEATAQYSYSNTPLTSIIQEIQQNTPYRFLYRESMISGIQLTFDADPDRLFPALKKALNTYGMELEVDSLRNQAILFRTRPVEGNTGNNISISGHTIDAVTGERLPLATVFWVENGEVKGVSSNSAGVFKISRRFNSGELILHATYVGYRENSIELNFDDRHNFEDISLRLEPKRINANELVITGSDFYAPVDTTLRSFLDLGAYSPLGENNSLRALQMLPSVGVSPALSGGIHIRGSDDDGLQVLLDGITIYKQSHLFGLLDSFNADVLQTGGFFYGIAPAQYQAPPGGTLSLYTKTGSLHQIRGTAGISNSTWRMTLEGPLEKGNSSWLISGRSSYMNSINWLNNSELIEWGLDVDRPRQYLVDDIENLETRVVRPLDNDATFFDLHGKLYFEDDEGDRLIISGYYGYDLTRQKADRLFRSFSTSDPGNTRLVSVESMNDWGNFTGSLQYQSQLGPNNYSFTTLAMSVYDTHFTKDDFTYTRYIPGSESFQSFTYPFENKSILNEIKARQQFDLKLEPFLFTGGVSYQFFLGEYFEESFDRQGYFQRWIAHKTDVFAQADFTQLDYLHIFAGNRVSYYSEGSFLRWSPRLQLKLFPGSVISLSGGYSRNHQFLNQISLSNVLSSEVWILAHEAQPPTSVDYVTAGLYLKPFKNHYLQVEGYVKHSNHLRLHEINSFSLTNTFNEAPWYSNNTGYGRGIEFLLHDSFGNFTFTQTFSISRTELQNEHINAGEPFLVDWDRTYNFTSSLQANLSSKLSINTTWMYATGPPNKLSVFGPGDQSRLGDYYRTDLTAEYNTRTSFGSINASLSIFNLFDRANPWYRDLDFVFDRSFSSGRFRAVPVNVYDIGFQPSFNLSVSF